MQALTTCALGLLAVPGGQPSVVAYSWLRSGLAPLAFWRPLQCEGPVVAGPLSWRCFTREFDHDGAICGEVKRNVS